MYVCIYAVGFTHLPLGHCMGTTPPCVYVSTCFHLRYGASLVVLSGYFCCMYYRQQLFPPPTSSSSSSSCLIAAMQWNWQSGPLYIYIKNNSSVSCYSFPTCPSLSSLPLSQYILPLLRTMNSLCISCATLRCEFIYHIAMATINHGVTCHARCSKCCVLLRWLYACAAVTSEKYAASDLLRHAWSKAKVLQVQWLMFCSWWSLYHIIKYSDVMFYSVHAPCTISSIARTFARQLLFVLLSLIGGEIGQLIRYCNV